MRDRTHARTSALGVIGSTVTPHAGQAPNFSLYLCATHPGL